MQCFEPAPDRFFEFWVCSSLRTDSEAACGVLAKEDDARGGSAQPVDRVCAGVCFCTRRREGVFHEAAAGESGESAGFVDGQQMDVFKQNFEVG